MGLFWLLIYIALIIISTLVYSAKGPIILAIICSFLLFGRLLRIGLVTESFQAISNLPKTSSIVSHWGPIIIYHSHHGQEDRLRGKEFLIGHKYFCTGCYGLLLGTIIAILFASSYLAYGISQSLTLVLNLSIPVWFIPIILRYTLLLNMSTIPRFLSNVLLPIGCAATLVSADFTFQSSFINGIIIFSFIGVSYLRGFVSTKEGFTVKKSNQNEECR